MKIDIVLNHNYWINCSKFEYMVTYVKRLRFLCLFFFSLIIIGISACKKSDFSCQDTTIDKFFELSSNANPLLHRVVNDLKLQEQHKPFVKNFIRQHGYPKWEVAKYEIVQKQNAVATTPDTIIIIPTLLGDEEFVKSLLEVKLSASAWYRIIDGFNLEEYGYNPVADQEYSNKLVSTFIYFEQLLFGEKLYKFTDKDLFLDDSRNLEQDTFYALPRIEVWDITFNWVCGYTVGGEVSGGCPPGVDHCIELIPEYCTVRFSVLVSTLVDDPNGGGGGWNPDISGGGGGGGSGQFPEETTMQCNRPFVRVHLIDNGQGLPLDQCLLSLPVSIYHVTNTINPDFPCLRNAFFDVTATRLTNCIYNLYDETFVGTNKVHNLDVLSISPLVDGNNNPVPAKSRVKPNDNTTYQIALNEDMDFEFTKEYWSSVILHELVHGFIQKNYLDFTATSQFQNIHQIMLTTWVDDIKEALLDIYPSMSVQDALCLAINGMSDMLSGDVNDTFRYQMTQWMQQYYGVDANMLGQVADAYTNGTKGTPCY